MSSPFASKLGTNYCPEDEEVTEIKSLLVDPSLQLERLDDEIADMQKAIDKLKEQRDSLAVYVEGHKALISPVRRLPLDIVQAIFMACIPTHRNCVMSAREAPVLLGRICSSWRMISLSTPRLGWSTSTALYEEKFAQRLETTKTWLGRSGQCPLSISLEGARHSATSTTLHNSSFFIQALIPFAPRWRHIQFTTLPITLQTRQTLFQLADVDVPMLESLALHQGSGLVRDDRLEWALFGMLHGPRISSFSMTGGNFTLPELPLRWDRLTSLSILHSDVGQYRGNGIKLTSEAALQIISRCPRLRSCKLKLLDPYNPTPEISALPIVEHSFLQEFELYCVDIAASTFSLLLGHLSLPQLRDFNLRCDSQAWGGHKEADDAISPLAHFLASSIHLKSFETGTETFSKSSMVAIFRSLPLTVQRLHIRGASKDFQEGWAAPEWSSLDDEILALLTPAPTVTACCPALRELHIKFARNISDTGLLDFITSRMALGPRSTLQRVQAMFSRQMQRDILPELQPFTETGLRLSITHHPTKIQPQFSPWRGLADGIETERSIPFLS
ncbi:hypothetical protein FB451DRAFT_1259602 [Mycena latifolia]|nr:hypothetical protein FB451DRAFT_1259602 [Mycena latifolia]